MKLTTDQALLQAIEENQDGKLIPYLTKIKHRIKHQKNLELSKKIEVLEKLGYKSNELLWKKTKQHGNNTL